MRKILNSFSLWCLVTISNSTLATETASEPVKQGESAADEDLTPADIDTLDAESNSQIMAPGEPGKSTTKVNQDLLGEVSLSQLPDPKTWQFAGGFSSVWSLRQDYGARSFKRFEPELIGFYYTKLPSPKLWLRHAARLGFSADQPQMPQSVRVEETDYKISIDEALVFDSIVTPTLAFGAGYNWRQIRAKREAPVATVDGKLNETQGFVWYYLQAGIGVPALQGQYMLEPLLRWQHLPVDRRTSWAFGFELTIAI
jgi:hypothetical protein